MQRAASQVVKIRLPSSLCILNETCLMLSINREELFAYFGSHLECCLFDCWPKPCEQLVRGTLQRLNRLLQHAGRESAPPSVCCRDARSIFVAEQNRQTVSRHYDANSRSADRERSIGSSRNAACTRLDDLNAVHLIQPRRFVRQAESASQALTILQHRRCVITDMQRQIQTLVRRPTHAADASRRHRTHVWRTRPLRSDPLRRTHASALFLIRGTRISGKDCEKFLHVLRERRFAGDWLFGARVRE